MSKSVIVVGTGNAALCAALAALENGAKVTLLEKADKSLSGGNTKYTAAGDAAEAHLQTSLRHRLKGMDR